MPFLLRPIDSGPSKSSRSVIRWGWPLPTEEMLKKVSYRFRSQITMTFVGSFCRLFATKLNRMKVYNRSILDKCLNLKTSLLTVTNHDSCIDDPTMWGMYSLRRHFNSINWKGWSPAADDIVFKIPMLCRFFTLGRTVPVTRGDGVYQPGMDFLLDRLNDDQWVHMYPQGYVIQDHSHPRLKWGVGRLIAESKRTPLIVPIWHCGFDDVLPNKYPYFPPRINKRITVLFGEPFRLDDLLVDLTDRNCTAREIRKAVTDRVQDKLYELHEPAKALHNSWS